MANNVLNKLENALDNRKVANVMIMGTGAASIGFAAATVADVVNLKPLAAAADATMCAASYYIACEIKERRDNKAFFKKVF